MFNREARNEKVEANQKRRCMEIKALFKKDKLHHVKPAIFYVKLHFGVYEENYWIKFLKTVIHKHKALRA